MGDIIDLYEMYKELAERVEILEEKEIDTDQDIETETETEDDDI